MLYIISTALNVTLAAVNLALFVAMGNPLSLAAAAWCAACALAILAVAAVSA